MGNMIDGGEIIARMIKNEGVGHIFTLSGGHVQNIYEGCLNNGIGIVDTRHEQSAGHAADGYSRITFKPGVAVVTAGPGVTDVVTAVANAYQAASPMVVIGGRSPLRQYDMGSLQDIELGKVMEPITKWSQTVYETRRLPYYMAMAFREAMTGKFGPTFLQIPSDVLFGRVDEDSVEWPTQYRTTGEVMGDPQLIKQAAIALKNAKKPMVMAGSGVFWHRAHRELADFARAADVPVYTNAMGRGSLPQGNPNFFSLSRKPAFEQADVILVLGTPIDFRLKYGRSPAWNANAQIIQIDIDPRDIGRNKDFSIGIEANIRQALLQLTGEIGKGEHSEWMTYLRGLEGKADSQREVFMNSDSMPIHPLRLCKEIAKFVDDDTIVVGDGGDIVAIAAGVLPINHPGQWMDPGPFGTLGVGYRLLHGGERGGAKQEGADGERRRNVRTERVRLRHVRAIQDAGRVGDRERPRLAPDLRRAEGAVRRGPHAGDAARGQRALRQGRRGAWWARRVRRASGTDLGGHRAGVRQR